MNETTIGLIVITILVISVFILVVGNSIWLLVKDYSQYKEKPDYGDLLLSATHKENE